MCVELCLRPYLCFFLARSVLYAGLVTFKLSCMYCFSIVRSAVVERRALKPCCVSDRGMCGVIVLRISLSIFLTVLHNKENGLYFHMCGLLLCTIV